MKAGIKYSHKDGLWWWEKSANGSQITFVPIGIIVNRPKERYAVIVGLIIGPLMIWAGWATPRSEINAKMGGREDNERSPDRLVENKGGH